MNNLIRLDNRLIDSDGNVVYYANAIMELLYRNTVPTDILIYPTNDVDVELFNKWSYKNFDDKYIKLPERLKTTDERKNNWFYPSNYGEIDLNKYFLDLLNKENIDISDEILYKNRVETELSLYKEKHMDKFLRFCIYFSDVMKEKNFVVGVGRGSSCASYLLYLLKIHLVNSVKYGLSIKEFLKD